MTAAPLPASDPGSEPDPGQVRYPGGALRIGAAYAWRLVIVGVALYLVLRVAEHLFTVIIPFTLSLLVTALLRPLLRFYLRRGLGRGLAAVATFLTAVIIVGGILAVVVTRALDQAPQLGDDINRLIPKIEHWLIKGPLGLNPKTVHNFSGTISKEVSSNSSAIASTAVSTGKAAIDVLTGVVLAIFSIIFLLYDGPRIWAFCTNAFPRAARPRVDLAGQSAWETLCHYTRGLLVVAVFHGVATAIALTVLGVPLVAPLALLVALGSFVPLVGAVATGAVAVGVAGLAQGLVAAIVMVAVLVIDNQIEAHLLQPFVVGRYVKIHPLATVLALATGAILLGIFGALIAVPLVACLNSFVRSITSGATAVEEWRRPPVTRPRLRRPRPIEQGGA